MAPIDNGSSGGYHPTNKRRGKKYTRDLEEVNIRIKIWSLILIGLGVKKKQQLENNNGSPPVWEAPKKPVRKQRYRLPPKRSS